MKEELIEMLTTLMIKQSIKDKKENQIECISKVGAFKSIIKLIKEYM